MKILEILRLNEMGYSQTKISISVNSARSTIQEVLKRCREVNLTYDKAQEMLSEEVGLLLYPKAAKKYFKSEPDYEKIYAEMQKHPKLNLRFLWTEYKEQHKDGLEYSQFCERFNRWQKKSGKKVTMHQEREPGKELFVDWIGDTLECIVDTETGELQKLIPDVAAGVHHYTYLFFGNGFGSLFRYFKLKDFRIITFVSIDMV
jgi:transposase